MLTGVVEAASCRSLGTWFLTERGKMPRLRDASSLAIRAAGQNHLRIVVTPRVAFFTPVAMRT